MILAIFFRRKKVAIFDEDLARKFGDNVTSWQLVEPEVLSLSVLVIVVFTVS